jgi:cytosine/adenosine deaminase-related metal-dependent hydrolase
VGDAERIRSSGAMVAHNCRSNMNNGVGRAPVDLLGGCVALGTDGIGSDMWEEARAAYLRRREMRIDVAPEWAVARLASGARVAGRAFDEPLLGTLVPGAPADLMVLLYARATPLSAENISDHCIFGISAGDVRDVIVGGEMVVRDRRLVRADELEIAAHAREESARLWRRMAEIPAHDFEPAMAAGMGAR